MAIVPLGSSREKQTCHPEVSQFQREKVSIRGKKAQPLCHTYTNKTQKNKKIHTKCLYSFGRLLNIRKSIIWRCFDNPGNAIYP